MTYQVLHYKLQREAEKRTVDEGSVQVAADERGLQSAGARLHSCKGVYSGSEYLISLLHHPLGKESAIARRNTAAACTQARLILGQTAKAEQLCFPLI